MSIKDKILIIDDEENIRELLSYNLKQNGYDTFTCDNGKKALDMVKDVQPQLILLDIMLPDMDGYDVCKKIRGDDTMYFIPIIMLTAKGQEFDKLLGLEIGADDYITKPFSVKEMLARVKALLRRNNLSKCGVKSRYGALSIDFSAHEVKVNDKIVDLTSTEFKVLEILVRNRGHIVTRDVLISEIWEYGFSLETRIIDVHIGNLRKKLEKKDNTKYIHTVRGIGYKFSACYNGDDCEDLIQDK